MKFIADFHIHSRYSIATSKNLDFENLYIAAQLKGITVVGTGDFTHPGWFSEIREKLVPAEPGLYKLKKEIAKNVMHRFRRHAGERSDLFWHPKSAIFIRKTRRHEKTTILCLFPTSRLPTISIKD